MIYQIYTEDLPLYRKAVEHALLKHGFKHYTMHPAVGYGPNQKGKREKSLIVWVSVNGNSKRTERKMIAATRDIRKGNGPRGQGSALLVGIPAYDKLVSDYGPTVGTILTSFGEWRKLIHEGMIVKGKSVEIW